MKHRSAGSRWLAAFLATAMCMGLLPGTAFAAQTGSTDASRTVFDALGIDTGAPEGYQQTEGVTDTPFGRTYTTMAEVDELFVANMNSKDETKITLYGDGIEKDSVSKFFSETGKPMSKLKQNNTAMASRTIEGNFSTANDGQKKNVAVISRDYGGTNRLPEVWLTTMSAADGRASDGDIMRKDFDCGGNPVYSYYNCFQVAAGDFDGDGIDEIAVCYGNNNIDVIVYKLQKTDGDSYLTADNWKVAWQYQVKPIDKVNFATMATIVAADVNKDGVDDLAFSYGAYKTDVDKKYSAYSKAVVAFGADRGKMLNVMKEVPLDGENLYRAGIAVGDLDKDGRNELVVGGSRNWDGSDRTVLIYAWNGQSFDKLASGSVNPKSQYDRYYSDSRCVANIAVGSFYGVSEAPCIYLDSIIFQYDSGGVSTKGMVSWTDDTDKIVKNNWDYTGFYFAEWGARAADFTGSGQDVIGINFSVGHDHDDELQTIQFLSFAGLSGDTTKGYYSASTDKKGESYQTRPIPFCLPNTDNDTIVLKYTGRHYYTYADPEVLAVLASPPYFADLANDDDDSQMIESKTSYGTSKGSGSGSSYSNSFSVGVYTSWEQSFSILGVELAHAEAEAAINNNFTWETQNTSSIEYAIEYATMAGMDTVVLYALPIETYVYEAAMPGGKTQTMTVNIPYQPSVRTISAEEYSSIQKVYRDILPDVSEVLTHTVGDPASYAKNVSELPATPLSPTLVYNGDFATIGQGSQNTISQSIEMTSEKEKSFNYDLEVEAKAGFGSGGVTVGVTAGYSHGAGSVHITTAGSSYSGEMNGLPTQAKQYGYSFNWKLAGFLWQGKYPVVTYLVNSVVEPPLLPENFGASETDTTTDRIALQWDYAGNAAGFILYRYFQSPSSSGYYKIATVSGSDYESVSDGVKHYQYIDEGLTANTGYQYRIQTIGLSQPNTSIPSEALSTYTKPETGTPEVEVSSGALNVHPDEKVSTTVYLTNSDEFKNAQVYYQWQKQSGRSWENLSGETAATLTFQYPDRGVEGVYRCKVSALVGQNLVTVYSPEVNVTFAQREAEISDLSISGDTLTATVKGSTGSAPTGTVNFVLTAVGGTETLYTAELENGKASVKVDMNEGIYKVTATYGGSKIFLPTKYDPETPEFYTKGVTSGRYLDVKDHYIYGDELNLTYYTIDENGKVTSEPAPTTKEHWYFYTGESYDGVLYPIPERAKRFYEEGRAGYITSSMDCYYYEQPKDETTGKFPADSKKYKINVWRKPLTITVTKDYEISAEATGEELKQLREKILSECTMDGIVPDWKTEDLANSSLDIYLKNGAGGALIHKDTASNNLAPGVYQMKTSGSSGLLCYDVTHVSDKTLTVTGAAYPVSAAVENGQSTYGTVKVSYPADADSAAVGQTLIFKAEPNPGYTVNKWYTYSVNADTKTEIAGSAGADTITLTQTNAGTNVIVSFAKKVNRLTTSASPAAGGTVTTADEYYQSGNAYPSGYEITFRAEPNPGWHFTGWEYTVSGQNTVYADEDSYTVEMPDSSVSLAAKFERDSYKLTLGRGLEAFADGKKITDLAAVKGDTSVTVKPAAGFALAADAQWTVNGALLDPQPENGEYTFTMTADTEISAAVNAQKFEITLNNENLTGGTASSSASGKIEAGTDVTFTAAPSRGYTFAGWTDADGKTVSTSAAYTFTVSGAVTLTPVFTEKESRTVTVGEHIDWSITDAEGSKVETDTAKLYPGETLTLTALPGSGKMVEGWTVNGAYTASVKRTMILAYRDLTDGDAITVTFQPITYFSVRFSANILATADGNTIASGDEVAAGSRMTFVYSNNADTSVRVIKWKNGDTEYPLAKQLVIDPLMSDLDISVETGELAFYDVNIEGEHFTDSITGTYEENGAYAAGSSVTIRLTPETDFRITEVNCPGAEITEADGIWTAVIERLDGDVTCEVTTESTAAPPTVTKFTVTFDADGGSVSPETMETDENGRLTALPTPTRSGYRFDGWFTAAGEKADENTVYTENSTLTAHWTKEEGGSTGGGGSSSGGGSTGGGSSGGGGSTGGGTTAPADPVTKPDTPENPTDNLSREPIAFTDIEGHWAKEYIDYASAHGLVSGTSSTTFSPDAPTTRAQLWTMLARQAGADLAGGETWYEKAQTWAKNSGVSDGSDPDGVITRAQMVTMLYRAAGSPEITGGSSFTDVPADSWYAKAVAWAAAKGITTGTGNGRFSPDEPCTRAQIAAFLYRSSQNS